MFHSMLLTLGYFYEYAPTYDITCEKRIYNKNNAEYTVDFNFRVLGVPFRFNAIYHLPNDSIRFTLKVERVNRDPNDYNLVETIYSTEQRKIREANGLHSKLYKLIVTEVIKEKERRTKKDMTEGLMRAQLKDECLKTNVLLINLLPEVEKQQKGVVGVKLKLDYVNTLNRRTEFVYELHRETGIVCTKLNFFIDKGMLHKIKASDNYNPKVTLNIDSVNYSKNTGITDYIRQLSTITTATPLNYIP